MKYELLKNLYYKDIELFEREYLKRFNSDCVYRLDITINGNQAFFLRTPDLYEKMIEIYREDAKLYHLYDGLPGAAIGQFIRKSLIGEIVGTNDIEHIQSSRSEINEVLITGKAEKNSRFADIINRYNMLGKEKLKMDRCADIREIYNDLLADEIGAENESNLPDGALFRRSGVNVHSVTDKIIHKGVQPESEIISYMTKALEFLHREDVAFFYRIAVFHYLFGYIHPFYDGNGRTSRFISSALLYEHMCTDILAFRLSYTLKENVNEYYKAFKCCNDPKNKGDLTPFVYMFLNMITGAMENLEVSLSEKNEKLNFYRNQLRLLPGFNGKHMQNIYYLLLQASLFSENGISKAELEEAENNISRGALDNCFKKIPDEMLEVKTVRRIKFYSLDLKRFDELISESL